MKSVKQLVYRMRTGAALIVSMIFVLVFSALAVSLATISSTNVQLADNQRTVNCALTAAQSGIDCAKYLAATVTLQSTGDNIVTRAQSDATWTAFCTYVQNKNLAGKTASFSHLATSDGNQLIIPAINYSTTTVDSNFTIRFYRYDNDPNIIKLESTGTDGDIHRRITVNLDIRKSADVLKYAIASKSRVWITGDSTIHGNIYSACKYQDISPFNITSDSTVEGTINTILTNI
ncbi:MAG: pilus assembly PilX N-terminal domain-containing protein, partial [Planctomycetota bacterium]|nr:pilus assembly PilX N-terminal domain-containing protein [Planctomycetota bacterium]